MSWIVKVYSHVEDIKCKTEEEADEEAEYQERVKGVYTKIWYVSDEDEEEREGD